MKRIVGCVVAVLLLSVSAYAHGGFEHLRGTVTQITATTLTIEIMNKSTKSTSTKTVTLADHTTFEKSGKPAELKDLKVGDRVIVEVPEGKSEAHIVKFGAPPPKSTAPANPAQHADHGKS